MRVTSGTSVTIGSLNGSGSETISSTTGTGLATLTVSQGTDGSVSNVIKDNGSGTFALVKSGSAKLTLTGANTYTGGTSINNGSLALGSAGAIGSSGTISFGGGTLQHSASNSTDYSGRFSTAATQQYKVDTNGQSVTWGTALTSSGGTLTKNGAGTLIFRGNEHLQRQHGRKRRHPLGE